MPLVCVGIGHHTAPVAVRERLAFSAAEQEPFLVELAQQVAPLGLGEVALLSTCNRTELYAASRDIACRFRAVPEELGQVLARNRGVSLRQMEHHRYHRLETDAVRHLCRVAAGLESMVVGEAEILGQVSAAQHTAERGGTLGPILEAAFRAAVRAGRRARAETAIGREAASISSEAVRLAEALGLDLPSATALIVGTGKVSRLAAGALRRAGARELRIVSRTTASASALAQEWGGRPLPWHGLELALGEADLVLSGTGAPHAVITCDLITSVLARRSPRRRLLLLDLAVPRDVEPGVREFAGVEVYDLDDIQQRIAENLAGRRQEIPAVEAIIADELERFEEWRHGVALRPILAALATQGEAIRCRELERALTRLDPVSPAVRNQLEALSRTIVAKLLHSPLTRIRDESDPARRQVQVEVVRELFGLNLESDATAEMSP